MNMSEGMNVTQKNKKGANICIGGNARVSINGTTDSANQFNESEREYEYKETDLTEVFKGEFIKMVFACIPVIIDQGLELIHVTSIYLDVLGALGMIALLYVVIQMINLRQINDGAGFVEGINLRKVFRVGKNRRIAGDMYKREGDKIIKVCGCKCPFCETEPIGMMGFVFDMESKEYILTCSENPRHELTFDFKKKIINP